MKIGIIASMVEEAALVRERMSESKSTTQLGMEFIEGSLSGRDVVLVVSGVGKVNAAVCAQVLIDRFEVTHLVFTGIAGSLDPKIDICDIVASTDCVQHDMDVSVRGFRRGVIPDQDVSVFKADEEMRAAAVRAIQEVAPDVKVWEGRVVSGDQFIADSVVGAHLAETFGAICCEMEGAAVAHVAWLNGMPFVVIRAISDKADGSAKMDYPTFKIAASNRSASVIERFVELL